MVSVIEAESIPFSINRLQRYKAERSSVEPCLAGELLVFTHGTDLGQIVLTACISLTNAQTSDQQASSPLIRIPPPGRIKRDSGTIDQFAFDHVTVQFKPFLLNSQ